MMMCQRSQVPRIRYLSPYDLGFFLLCWREATLSNHQIVHSLLPPPFFQVEGATSPFSQGEGATGAQNDPCVHPFQI